MRSIQSAEVLVGAAIYGQACFHCQQCVEKVFKSVLVKQDRLVPRIHSIFTLSKLLPLDLLVQIPGDITIFDDFYMPARYPDAMPDDLSDAVIGKTEATEALALAKDIFTLVQHYLAVWPSDNT